MSELNTQLRNLRVESGMSQSEVSHQVGLSRSAVTQIELGRREISAQELGRFAEVFGRSPSALLASPSRTSADLTSDEGTLLEELLRAMGEQTSTPNLAQTLTRLMKISKELTKIEEELEVHVYGPETLGFMGATPRSTWECIHQGYAAAEDERRRLDLGSTPIRDLLEILATLRIRATRAILPESVFGLFFVTNATGPIIVVNESATLEDRRFQFAHGLAHLLFDRHRQWIVCDKKHHAHHHEVRASAFASGILVPPSGLHRYLQSIGRDTLPHQFGRSLEVLANSTNPPANRSRVRATPRPNTMKKELSPFEIFQVATFFGVTTSLVAQSLRNLGHLSENDCNRLTSIEGERQTELAGRAIRLSPDQTVREHDPFISRLLSLVAEGRRRGLVSTDRIELISQLLMLSEEERCHLLGKTDPSKGDQI